ncbi:MAG TPA: glycogen/starch/alpha-glucan phosphorylase [Roseiarcus sp.]|nr:glycogen/starch/alpha-glucan phosphorylase [Roseiarcus sp.]
MPSRSATAIWCLLLEPKFPSVLNTANVGWFSSDRTIAEYAKEIWNAPFAPIS